MSINRKDHVDLPPILQDRRLHLIEIGEDEHGAYLKFAANRNRVREVTLYMLAHGPVKWEYVYSLWDASTRTVTTYQGPHGDPERDRRVDMRGA